MTGDEPVSLLQELGKHPSFMKEVARVYNEYKWAFEAMDANITKQVNLIRKSAIMNNDLHGANSLSAYYLVAPNTMASIGTGKYKFVEWKAGQYITLERNDEYFGEMPSIKETGVNWVKFLQPYLPAEQWEKLFAMMNAIPEPEFMIHGDYHANNVMVQDGEPLLIDMDTVGYGHAVFDFAAIYLACVGYCECNHAGTMDFYGLPYEITVKIWETLLKQYFEDEAMREDVARKAKVIGYARMMRRTIRRNGLNTPDGQELIALCKQRLSELLPQVEQLYY